MFAHPDQTAPAESASHAVEALLAAAEALHERIVAAHADYRRCERDLALLLAGMADDRLHEALGYASVHDYASTVLDLSPRQALALVRIGRRLPSLPAIDAAFARGDLGWTKARELMRVATPANEAAWVERASGLRSRDLERHVSQARDGQPPPFDEVGKGPSRRRLVFDLDAQDADVIRAALAALRAAANVSDREIEDGALLAEMARRVLHDLHGEQAPTAERYRTVLERCPDCALTTGLDAEVNETHVGMARCDGETQEMDEPRRGYLRRGVPPATRRAVLHRDRQWCAVPACSNTLWLDVHHVIERHRGGGNEEDNLITVCDVHHRVVHEGLLAIHRVDDAFAFEFLDGRRAQTVPGVLRSRTASSGKSARSSSAPGASARRPRRSGSGT